MTSTNEKSPPISSTPSSILLNASVRGFLFLFLRYISYSFIQYLFMIFRLFLSRILPAPSDIFLSYFQFANYFIFSFNSPFHNLALVTIFRTITLLFSSVNSISLCLYSFYFSGFFIIV